MTEEEKAPYINAAREVEKPKHKPFKKVDYEVDVVFLSIIKVFLEKSGIKEKK